MPPDNPIGSALATSKRLTADSPRKRQRVLDDPVAFRRERHAWALYRIARVSESRLNAAPVDLFPLIAQIATRAKIPSFAQANIAQLCKSISYEIAREWSYHRGREHNRPILIKPDWYRRAKFKMNRVQQLSRELLSYLDTEADCAELDPLWLLTIGMEQHVPGTPDGNTINFAPTKEAIATLDLAASQVLSMLQAKSQRKQGRPSGYPHWVVPGSFDGFVLRLLWDVGAAGGRLSLSKNTGTGSLIKVLDLLRPHLPPKFIPSRPSLAALNRIKRIASKVGTLNMPVI
jgi:hypothetical protein